MLLFSSVVSCVKLLLVPSSMHAHVVILRAHYSICARLAQTQPWHNHARDAAHLVLLHELHEQEAEPVL
jgi:hypothetical protein